MANKGEKSCIPEYIETIPDCRSSAYFLSEIQKTGRLDAALFYWIVSPVNWPVIDLITSKSSLTDERNFQKSGFIIK